MNIVCLDLEGVLIPEVWINFAERTGIEDLRLTTRDIPDYDELMTKRLKILDDKGFKMADIEAVISEMKPMEGANDFLDELRSKFQVVILSDTFYEFGKPFMRQLDWPTLFCHRLEIDENDRITAYKLRMTDHKRKAVDSFRALNFTVFAAGDSYNDTTMLGAADRGFLFRSPDNVIAEFPQFPHETDYSALLARFEDAAREAG